MDHEKILEVRNLKQYFKLNQNTTLRAVDDVSFSVNKGEVFALVGESGSGKSTVGKSIVGVHEITDGEIFYRDLRISDRRVYRRHKTTVCGAMQMIFQDAASAMNARLSVGEIIGEPLLIRGVGRAERRRRADGLLTLVGLDAGLAERYPGELSGGQRQRVGIARALAVNPELILADEPIASLDASMQAQMVNLFKQLQRRRRLTCLFIAHDLTMVKRISDRVGVMYKGKLVEMAATPELFANPIHPYTKALLAAVPVPDPRHAARAGRAQYHPYVQGRPSPKRNWREMLPNHFVYGCAEEF